MKKIQKNSIQNSHQKKLIKLKKEKNQKAILGITIKKEASCN